MSTRRLRLLFIATTLSFSGSSFLSFLGCSGSFNSPVSDTPSTSNTDLTAQNELAASLKSAKITFNYSDFYSLSSPNPSNGCAGDANTFYDPITLSGSSPKKLPTSVVDSSTTIRPAFIKNISVDLTDANSTQTSNRAFSCSLGDGPNAPAASSCASFDSSALGGSQSNYERSLVLMGGSQSGASFFALGVNSLPPSVAGTALAPGLNSSSVPISIWNNISGSSSYAGPSSIIGASADYESLLKKLLFFGGVSPVSVLGTTSSGITNYETWTYDLKTQTWTHTSPVTFSASYSMQKTVDYSASAGTTYQISRSMGGRSLFGYLAMPGMAISQLSSTGSVTGASGSGVDTTDRIIVVGGYGSCANAVCTDIHRLNPTYAPEYMDTQNAISPQVTNPSPLFPTQWIDSYPIQLMSNSLDKSNQIPSFPPATPALTSPYTLGAASFGIAGLSNNYPSSSGVGINGSTPGAGYLLVAGGFYAYAGSLGLKNVAPSTGCSSINTCGDMKINLKWYNSSWSQTNETSASNFASVTNFIDTTGNQNTPSQWKNIADSTGSNTTPWFGGGVMLTGINIPTSVLPTPIPAPYPAPAPGPEFLNQVVFFGGADCRDYMFTSTASDCPNWPSPGNPGRYWVFGLDPAYTFHTGTEYPTQITMGGTVPINAGMSAARGTDLNGNPLIVAWGGMKGPAQIDNTGTIYYLYNNSGVPTWGSVVPSSSPLGESNAALVFSHVTGNFYLFGGYNPVVANGGTNADTWQLSISSSTPGCGVSTTASCQFTWKLLNSVAGLTCYPNCPPVRRSHRMVEVNYNHLNAPAEPVCTSATSPCSFGIFMEGGTSNGLAYSDYNDRWMFDPTANSGAGHWQLMGELPPRSLASLTNIHYTVPSTNTVAHRALLFGGQTGLQTPGTSGYFIPPTLGDTWMYDYDNSIWNRVALYGHRYTSSATFSTTSELEARSSSLVTDTTTQVFSPPPTAGGIMITRTLSKSTHLASELPTSLSIPEVFFLGGRKKDGTYNLLNSVYKFCAGSTGEKPYPTSLKGTTISSPDDASCDFYDATTNPNSPNPSSGYVGRWLVKTPTGTGGFDPSTRASFMGAGTYDSVHDLIVAYGGIRPSTSPYSTTVMTDSSNRTADSSILEYTPPSAVQYGSLTAAFNGSWKSVPACPETVTVPTARYGHSLGYDAQTHSLILTGGTDMNGNLLTQTQTFAHGSTYTAPEVWSARRVDEATSDFTLGPFPCYYWSQVTVFGNSSDSPPPLTGLTQAASVYVPSSTYNTSFYATHDSACIGVGPISSSDPDTNKLLAGGAYIDIDRSQLGSQENLILNLTFIPLGGSNLKSDQTYVPSNEAAVFKIHLVKVGESGDEIRQRVQPRYFTYASTDQYPQPVQDLAILTPPTGQVRQEQVVIPLSMDPAIDRIRIERYSGNAILIDASIFRLGQH